MFIEFCKSKLAHGSITDAHLHYEGSITIDEDLLNEDFAAHYDKFTNVTDGVETIKDTTASGEGLSFRGLFDVTFGAAFTAIQLVFCSLGLFGSMSVDVIADFTFLDRTVVSLFFTGVFTIITISLVWVWLSSIARGKF